MTRSIEQTIRHIEETALRMRRHILDMALKAGSHAAHLGGGLSIVDITATLYGAVMQHDATNPQWSERDRFILSKGHGVLGYYSALAEAGYLSREELMTFEEPETLLCGHPIMNRDKGIEFSNGSLGMGLSLGIGVALAGRRRKLDYRTFVLMGDGECNEGSVWEAAMAAAHYRLDHLVAIIDRNRLQQTGEGSTIMDLGDIAAKWRAFGWQTVEVDGHDIEALLRAFTAANASGLPLAVVADTVKGKGFAFSENNNDWHHGVLTRNNYDAAVIALEEALSDA
ncbi:MAG: transketolase [Gammaproteobacteria bacterium]|nr:transketolase [Gammaproteobacteria bacterium]